MCVVNVTPGARGGWRAAAAVRTSASTPATEDQTTGWRNGRCMWSCLKAEPAFAPAITHYDRKTCKVAAFAHALTAPDASDSEGPCVVDLDLALRDETGLIVASGIMAIVEGTETMAAASPQLLRELGIELIQPLLFVTTTFGEPLEDEEPERHRGKTPQPHAKRRKPQ